MDGAILDLGSYTFKAGVPYNFPSDGEPSVVRSLIPVALGPIERIKASRKRDISQQEVPWPAC
jgi:hypothetical protein